MIEMSTSQGKNVLITGAAGFVGFEVTKTAVSRGYSVTAVDGLLAGLYPAEEKKERWAQLGKLPGVTLLEADIRTFDWSAIDSTFDYVINLAAMPGLALSWNDFDLYESCNFQAVARLQDAAQSWPLKKFIQISTSSVYGLNAVGDEDRPLEPVSPYGVTKLAAEQLLLAHFRTRNFPVAILRYFSVYGPGQRPDMAYRKFIQSALRNEPITLYGDGSQSRTNTYVTDVAEATVNALTGSRVGQIYNICGNEETTMSNAIEMILELTQSSSVIITQDRIPGDQDKTAGDSTKASNDFDFRPNTTLRDGLAREVEYVAKR
jgi:nucleoside-diphosphate-sugar epimerase